MEAMNPKDSTDLPPLPKIYNDDKRIAKPEDFFKINPRYKFGRLLGHGAYGLVA